MQLCCCWNQTSLDLKRSLCDSVGGSAGVCFCDRYFGNISHLARNAFSQMRRHQRAGMESRLFQNQNYFGIKATFFWKLENFSSEIFKTEPLALGPKPKLLLILPYYAGESETFWHGMGTEWLTQGMIWSKIWFSRRVHACIHISVSSVFNRFSGEIFTQFFTSVKHGL